MNSRVLSNRWEYGRLRRRGFFWSLLVTALFLLALFSLLLLMVRVSDTGMSPTLKLGDVVLFDRLSHHFSMPDRGDVFALRQEGGVGLGRIIALPGETVTIQNGNVYIDGVFLRENTYVQYASLDMDSLKLGQGEFFVLPDSRGDLDLSLTAGAMVYGASELLGEARMIVSPLSSFGIF